MQILITNSLPSSLAINFGWGLEVVPMFLDEYFLVCAFLFLNGTVDSNLIKLSNTFEKSL